jgi:hypothetical protein
MDPETTDRIRKAKSALGVATRRNDTDAARQARRDLAAAKIEQYVRRVVEEAPPLSPQQRDHLASLLDGGRQ